MSETTPPNLFDHESPSEGRVDDLDRQAFEVAVIAATKAAVSEIAPKIRNSMVWRTAAAAFLASLLVFAVGGYIVYQASKDSSRSLASYNCLVLTRQAEVLGSGNNSDLRFQGKPEGFVSSDALLRRSEALSAKKIKSLQPGALKSLFTDPQTTKLSRKASSFQAAVTHYWSATLVPALQGLARVNCSAH